MSRMHVRADIPAERSTCVVAVATVGQQPDRAQSPMPTGQHLMACLKHVNDLSVQAALYAHR